MEYAFKNVNDDEDYGALVILDGLFLSFDYYRLYYFQYYLSLPMSEYNSNIQYLVVYKLVLFDQFLLFYKLTLDTILLFFGSYLYPSY